MGDKLRMLVVSDSESGLQNLRNVVRHHSKLKADYAEGGSAGLAALTKNEPYQAIISDLGQSGVTTADLQQVALSREPDTRVVVVAGFGDQADIIRAIQSGIYGYLHKPFGSEELNLMLNNLTHHFQLAGDVARLKGEVTALEEAAQAKLFQAKQLEEELAGLRREMRTYKPDEEPESALERAIHEAAQRAVGRHHGYRVFQELSNLNQLREENKISAEEYEAYRKNVLGKAYE